MTTAKNRIVAALDLTGTVLYGTMAMDDLIPAFADLLEKIREHIAMDVKPGEELELTQLTGRIDYLLCQIERRQKEPDYYGSEDADHDLEALSDWLNDFAPAGHYFGSNPGDGCDYGFWQYDSDSSDSNDDDSDSNDDDSDN